MGVMADAPIRSREHRKAPTMGVSAEKAMYVSIPRRGAQGVMPTMKPRSPMLLKLPSSVCLIKKRHGATSVSLPRSMNTPNNETKNPPRIQK